MKWTTWQSLITQEMYYWHAGGLAPPDVGNEEIEAANPWGMLLRTFLPWVNAGQVPDYVNQQEEEEAVHDQEAEGTEHDGAIPEEDDLD